MAYCAIWVKFTNQYKTDSMKNIIIAILLCFASPTLLFAQAPGLHSTPESRQKSKDRSDYSLFRRQITALKEFAEERKKIPALQKENKEVIKVYVTMDSTESDDTMKNKFLQGFITQQIGDVSTNAYELTFDRTLRKITTVKRTGESTDPEPAEIKEKPAPKKGTEVKKTAPKKKKTGDDDDEEEEEEKEEKTPAGKEKDD